MPSAYLVRVLLADIESHVAALLENLDELFGVAFDKAGDDIERIASQIICMAIRTDIIKIRIRRLGDSCRKAGASCVGASNVVKEEAEGEQITRRPGGSIKSSGWAAGIHDFRCAEINVLALARSDRRPAKCPLGILLDGLRPHRFESR